MGFKVTEKSKVSITVLLSVAMGLLVATSLIVVMVLTVSANIRNTRELLQRSANDTILALEAAIAEHIEPSAAVVNGIAKQVARGNLDIDDDAQMKVVLRTALTSSPRLTGVVLLRPGGVQMQAVYSPSGRILVGSASVSDQRRFTVFVELAKARKKAFWLEPQHEDGFSFVSYVAPLFQDKMFKGLIISGVSIGKLSSTISRFDKSGTWTPFILYGKDKVLAHHKLPALSKEKIKTGNPLHDVSELKDPVLSKLWDSDILNLVDEGNIEVRGTQLDEGYMLTLSKQITSYGQKPWIIGIYAPSDEVNTQLKRTIASAIAGFIMLLVAVVAAMILARRVARPVKKVALAADKIGRLELDKIDPLPPSRIAEINQQSVAINRMVDGLRWFEAYIPRQLVRRLMDTHGARGVESQQMVLTVMFTDIIGFTAKSEKLEPSEVAARLNAHFEGLMTAINATGGTLDKYIGDAAMAFWGAPEAQPDHARRACETAVQIMEAAATARDHDTRIKVSIHTGPLIVGNIGARARMNYTVIGDTVNTCSRIEKIAGDLDEGAPVVAFASQETKNAAGDGFRWQDAGEHAVKGREKAVKVYQLLGRS